LSLILFVCLQHEHVLLLLLAHAKAHRQKNIAMATSLLMLADHTGERTSNAGT
jgi:hypothetical protein